MVRKESCMTRGVDSRENTLHTTSGNEGKLSWDNTARRKTMAETSSTIYSPNYIYRKREVIWRQT